MKSFFIFGDKRKTTLKHYSFRTVQFSFKQGITFYIIFVSAKMLSSYEFGVFSFLFATIMFFTVLSDFGVSRSTSKLVTEETVNKKHLLEKVFFNGLVIILLFGLLCLSVLLIFKELILDEFSNYIIYMLPMVFLFPVSSLFDGYYLGQKKFDELAKVFSIAGVLALIIDTYLIINYKLIGALISVNVFYLLLTVLFFFKHQKKIYTIHYNVIKKILSYAVLIGLPGIGFFLFTRANVYLLGKLNFIVESGYYEFIDRALIAAAFPFLMFGQVYAPTVTEKIALDKKQYVYEQFKKIFVRAVILACILALLAYFAFPQLVKIFYPTYYNDKFIEIFKILIILLPFNFISNTVNEPFIVGSGLARISLLTIPFGVLNILLSLFLVNYFSFWGILYSNLFCSISNKTLSYFFIYKKLK